MQLVVERVNFQYGLVVLDAQPGGLNAASGLFTLKYDGAIGLNDCG
nr:hypothetical protein [Ferrimonas kyonanensis]